MRRYNIQERILIHLRDFYRAQEEFVVPVEVTQHGIARALGIERSNVPYAVKRLSKKDLVEERVSHVEGEKRRKKAYFLSPLGYREANKLRQELSKEKLSVKKGESVTELALGELARELGLRLVSLTTLGSRTSPIEYKDIERLGAEKLGKVRVVPPLPPLRRYFGRTKQEEDIYSALSDPKVTAVVVYGIAGVGKTTLARHLVDGRLSERNVWWGKLHEWDTPRSVLASLAEFLRAAGKKRFGDYIGSRKIIDVGEAVRTFYEEAKGLEPVMILDDYHTAGVELTQLFNALLENAGREEAKLLLFGRERKPFYDRRDVVITSRVVEKELKGLDRESAICFLDALNVKSAVHERVYEATKGHPLAIELLHISDPVRFSKSMDLSRFFFEEIFSSLSQEEMSALNRLSVYRDPIPWEAIDGASEPQFLELERRAIVTATEAGLYSIHETLVGVIYSALDSDERARCHMGAAEYYGAEFLEDELPDELLQEQEADLVELLYHLIRGREYTRTLELISRYGELMVDRGYLEEYMVLMNEFPSVELDADGEAAIEKLKGDILTVWGDWAEASELYESALKKADDQLMRGKLRNKLGTVQEHLGRWDAALAQYGMAIEVFDKVGYKLGIAETKRTMGIVFRKQGKYEKAVKSYEASLAMFEELDDTKGLARAYNSIGVFHDVRGAPKKAREYFLKSLEYSREAGEKRMMGAAYNNIGESLKLEGRHEDALEYYRLALKVQEELGEKQGIAVSLNNVGWIQVALGETREGKSTLENARELAAEISDRYLEGSVLRNLGLANAGGDPAIAKEYLDEALETYTSLGAIEKVKLVRADLQRLALD